MVDASEGGRAVVDVSLREWSGSMWPQRALDDVESIDENFGWAGDKGRKRVEPPLTFGVLASPLVQRNLSHLDKPQTPCQKA